MESPTKTRSTVQATAQCRAVLTKVLAGREDRFELGQTRVYFKAGILEELEASRAIVLQGAAVTVQRFTRGWRLKHAFGRQKAGAVALQSFGRMLRAKRHYASVRHDIVRIQVTRS